MCECQQERCYAEGKQRKVQQRARNSIPETNPGMDHQISSSELARPQKGDMNLRLGDTKTGRRDMLACAVPRRAARAARVRVRTRAAARSAAIKARVVRCFFFFALAARQEQARRRSDGACCLRQKARRRNVGQETRASIWT